MYLQSIESATKTTKARFLKLARDVMDNDINYSVSYEQ